ncbi:sphinganine C4-monooxygenase 2 [Phoenix dactylifera]|uniref:aldehyde oxygenase (deformylating) n=1 Tax=Phoenix dactylifera TaxID=42345 RepID=A0A8B8ZXI1_PHODC|nr:sphinganine C4-monooxygenase 2 [Phoenix dactylifera]
MKYFHSDEFLATFVPILVYWVYSGVCMMLYSMSFVRCHRLHPEGDDTENVVAKSEVIPVVLLQQVIQATIASLVFQVDSKILVIFSSSTLTIYLDFLLSMNEVSNKILSTNSLSILAHLQITSKDIVAITTYPPPSSIMVQAGQILIAMLVFDTWQYFMHRCMHHSKFLYRHFHSWHHRLVAPYAFGAQYNHPVDGILIETVAGALSYFISGMSPKTSILFFSLATIKGIDDHCGLLLPWNPFHMVFENNTAYHDIHHQLSGCRYNYSQPFFVMWDKILGTYKPCSRKQRLGKGLEPRH